MCMCVCHYSLRVNVYVRKLARSFDAVHLGRREQLCAYTGECKSGYPFVHECMREYDCSHMYLRMCMLACNRGQSNTHARVNNCK